MEALSEHEMYEVTGINGERHRLDRKILLTWQLNNSSKSYSTYFFVADEAPFDLLLGNDFLKEHDILKKNRSFLFLGLRRRATGKEPSPRLITFSCLPTQNSRETS